MRRARDRPLTAHAAMRPLCIGTERAHRRMWTDGACTGSGVLERRRHKAGRRTALRYVHSGGAAIGTWMRRVQVTGANLLPRFRSGGPFHVRSPYGHARSVPRRRRGTADGGDDRTPNQLEAIAEGIQQRHTKHDQPGHSDGVLAPERAALLASPALPARFHPRFLHRHSPSIADQRGSRAAAPPAAPRARTRLRCDPPLCGMRPAVAPHRRWASPQRGHLPHRRSEPTRQVRHGVERRAHRQGGDGEQVHVGPDLAVQPPRLHGPAKPRGNTHDTTLGLRPSPKSYTQETTVRGH